jgi:hypothetical protein
MYSIIALLNSGNNDTNQFTLFAYLVVYSFNQAC